MPRLRSRTTYFLGFVDFTVICNFAESPGFELSTRPKSLGKTREAICDDESLLCYVSQYWDLPLPWVRTGQATGVIFGTTESIAAPTGATCVVIDVTLLATGIN
jgi:hypothetical protein